MDPAVNGIQGAHIAFAELIQDFYARRAYRPAWGDAKNASELRRAIADSAADGLNPADYFQPLLEDLARQARDPAATPMLHAQHDILLTEALLRLGYHLSFGKVDPETFDAQWNYGRTLDDRDIAGRIERALASQDVYQRIEALKPTHRLYGELKRELARYLAAESSAAPAPVPAGDVETGGERPAGAAGARPAGRERRPGGEWRGSLRGVRRRAPGRHAQVPAAHGSRRRWRGGAGTVTELNVPVAERIRLLRVNLDPRTRDYARPARAVRDREHRRVHGLPACAAGTSRGTGRVQVGKTYRKTPLFRSEINYLVFNPTWTVPPGIIANDILPAAKADPASITRRGLKVLDSAGREVDPATVDWSRFRGGHIPYTLRQDPGPKNALGRVKLMFPNPYLVYLHDTPSQALFDKADRAFSSGCVRVERALELAELVLNDPGQWNAQSIAAVIQGGKLQNVTLKQRMPVLLAYWTTWVDPEGRVNFRRDLYGQDAKWAEALDAPFRVRTRPLFSDAPATPASGS